jgi:hypothetical protein
VGGYSGLLLKVNATDGTVVWSGNPASDLAHLGVVVGGGSVFTAGAAVPPTCGAVDGVGGTEGKPFIAIYSSSSGANTSCGSMNVYSYKGHESYYALAGGGGLYYAAGWAEEFGFGGHRYLVTKYDATGAPLITKVDPATYSFAEGAATDSFSAVVYIAGFRRTGSWHGLPELPFLVKLDASLNELWRSTIDAAASGARGSFSGVALAGSDVYAVGSWTVGSDTNFLAAKFSAAGGPPVWQQVWGTSGADRLRDVVVTSTGRVFATGGSAGDVVVLELNPADGSVLPSPLPYATAGDDFGMRLTADGPDLFVAGYASPSGNYDALLLHYRLTLTVSIDIRPGTFPNAVNPKSKGVLPVAILSSATFDATSVDPATVKLAGATVAPTGNGALNAVVTDVNLDGLPDLLLHIATEELLLTPADTEAVLTGKTFSGQLIQGSDSVRVLP